MPRPFKFKWGPSELLGLGVRLEAEQADVLQTPGYAVGLTFQHDVLAAQECCENHFIEDANGDVQMAPVFMAVDVDDEMGHLSDQLDRDWDPMWRRFASGVAVTEGGWTRVDTWDDPMYLRVWDTVMVDEAMFKAMQQEAGRAYADSNASIAVHFANVFENWQGTPESEVDPYDLETMKELAAVLGVKDLTIDSVEYYPDLTICAQPYHFDTEGAQKIWENLQRGSKQHWSSIRSVQHMPDTTWRYEEGALCPWL